MAGEFGGCGPKLSRTGWLLLMHFCLLSWSILTMILHSKTAVQNIPNDFCQHSTFKNNDDFHSFTRETKRSLMQGVQQRLIIIVLMFCTILFMIRIYLFLSYHSTSAILATDVCPRGVEDRFTSVAKTADVESCLTKQIN